MVSVFLRALVAEKDSCVSRDARGLGPFLKVGNCLVSFRREHGKVG